MQRRSPEPVRAVGAGAFFVAIAVKQWVFTLSAIGEAGLGETASTGVYLFYVLATQTMVLPSILVYSVAPQRAARLLKGAQTWLERHNRAILVSMSLIFGVWFFNKGVTGLIRQHLIFTKQALKADKPLQQMTWRAPGSMRKDMGSWPQSSPSS